MKGLLKFSTAALALAALASCSNDEFLSESNGVKVGKNALHVTVEGMVDPLTTRVAFTPNAANSKGTLYWQEGDEIRVLDGDLRKYDPYQFSADAASFLLADPTGTKYANPVKYALFGTTSKEGWDRETNSVTAEFTINSTWAWAEDEVSAGEGKLAFVSNLPMAGTAEETDGEVSVSLEYTTGIFRIDMENVPGNVEKFVLKGYKSRNDKTEPAQLTGQFTAKLATDGVFNEKNVVLEPTITKVTTQNTITVSLSKATREKTSLFIPVIAGYYGRLEFYYVTKGDIEEGLQEDDKNPYKVINNFTVERGKFYGATIDTQLKTAGNTPSAITKALGLLESGEEDLTLAVQQQTTVSTADNTITIPEALSETNLTLDLKKFLGKNQTLYIDSEKEYTGKLTVSLSQGSEISNIRVDLPAAEVAFVGELENTSIGVAPVNGKYTLGALNVKALTIGDGTTDTYMGGVYVNAECSKAFYSENPENEDPAVVVMEKAEVSKLLVEDYTYIQNVAVYGTVTNELNTQVKVVNDKGRVDDKLNLSVATGNKTVVGTMNVRCEVELKGDANASTVNIDLGSYDVSLEDKAYIATLTGDGVNDLTIEGNAYVDKAEIKGDATISLDAETEAEAVKNSLYVNAGKKVNLNGGYIKEIKVLGGTDKNRLTVVHGNKPAFTAIGSFTGSGYWKIDEASSVWNGKKISDTATKPFGSYKQGEVYTANQLASLADVNDNVNIYSNIDLNKNDWSSFMGALTGDLDGKSHTIKNGTLNYIYNAAVSTNVNVGLFTTVETGKKIENLIVKDFAVNATAGTVKTLKVGTLAGSAAVLTINNVTIEDCFVVGNITGSNYVAYVGGLIGNTTGVVTIGADKADGSVDKKGADVKLKRLSGQYNVGGLIGGSTKTVNIYNSSVDITDLSINLGNLKPTIDPTKDNATKAGSVGMYIGLAQDNVVMDEFNKEESKIVGNRTDLKFKESIFNGNSYSDITGATDGNTYAYFGSATLTELGYIYRDKTANVGDVKYTSTLEVKATVPAETTSTKERSFGYYMDVTKYANDK